MKSLFMYMMRSLITYQKILIAVIIVLSKLNCVGQIRSNDNNSMMGIFNNPSHASNNDSTMRLNLFSFESWAGGSRASIYLKDIFNVNNNFFREKVLGNNTIATGWGGVNIQGPSLIITPNKTFSFGLTTRLRVFANYWDVDGRLISEIEEDDKVQQQYPYNLAGTNNMMANVMAWSDIGLSFSMKIIKKADYTLRGGVSFHYLSGLSHSSVSANINGGTINVFGGNLPYLTNVTGSVATFTSGDFFNKPSVNNLLKNDGSLGLDLGLVYEYLPRKLKIGASIIDIGKVNFIPNQQYSKSYDMNVPLNGGYLFLTQNFPNTPFNHLTIPLDSNGFYFKQKKINADKYSIALPTALHLNADVQIQNDFYLNVALSTGLQPRNSISAMYAYRSLFFIPRYETKKFSLQLPLSYQSYIGFNAGLAGRFGPVYIGSSSLLSGLFTKSKQLDAYAGIEIQLKKKRIVPIANPDLGVSIQEPYKKFLQETRGPEPSIAPFKNTIHGFMEVQSVNTTNNVVPFWMRSNNYGSNPIAGISTSFIGRIQKDYDTSISTKKINWSSALEVRSNAGSKAQAILIEAYAQAKFNIFQLKIGRSKDIVGTVDPDLSSGSFAVSGNTLGIPKIELSIPDYWGKGFVSMRGSLAHGWLGKQLIGESQSILQTYYTDSIAKTYYHQFSIYGRLGRPSAKLKFYGGINHEVFWGNERKFSPRFQLSNLEEYFYVAVGRPYSGSKIGNHVGTLDMGAEYEFNKIKIMGYHQFFYDAGALFRLANLRDGLTGISIINKDNFNKRGFFWKKVLAEFMYSVNQAGQLDSKITFSGDEDYYHNATYRYGWSYKGEGLGTPFITPQKYARVGLPSRSFEFFINNRVSLFHVGFVGGINSWDITAKLSFSQNFGTYGTSPIGNSTGIYRFIGPPPYFQEVDQFSGYLAASKGLKNGYKIGFMAAMDIGGLLYSSQGLIIKFSKTF